MAGMLQRLAGTGSLLPRGRFAETGRRSREPQSLGFQPALSPQTRNPPYHVYLTRYSTTVLPSGGTSTSHAIVRASSFVWGLVSLWISQFDQR